MIFQVTTQELKTLISRTSRKLNFYLLKDQEEGFGVELFSIAPKEEDISIEKKPSVPYDQLDFFLQKKDSYPVYHIVQKPQGFLKEKFGDDNAGDFMSICNRLYYRHYKDEKTHGMLDELVGLFKRDHEVAEGLLNDEFDQS